MELSIDKFGRILIPAWVRRRPGLSAGSALRLNLTRVEDQEIISLEPVRAPGGLVEGGDLLVHEGTLLEAPDEVIRRVREERLAYLASIDEGKSERL
jgi:AbrB family looped-hinge helix DNA binding protein